jgi:hypothetical protein
MWQSWRTEKKNRNQMKNLQRSLEELELGEKNRTRNRIAAEEGSEANV